MTIANVGGFLGPTIIGAMKDRFGTHGPAFLLLGGCAIVAALLAMAPTLSAADVRIDVGKEYVLTPTLEVGAIQETVNILEGSDIVNSTNAELSNTVTETQLLGLPINGRDPSSLIQLQPGVSQGGGETGQHGSIRPPTQSTSGCASIVALIAGIQSAAGTTSSSRNAITSALASCTPVLRAFDAPRLGS